MDNDEKQVPARNKGGRNLSEAFEIAVDHLLSHRNEFARELLQSRSLRVSGTQETLRRRLIEAGAAGKLRLKDVVDHLNEIEGWGNQHIYAYKSDRRQLGHWRDQRKVVSTLSGQGLADRLNSSRAIYLPRTPHLSTVLWSPDRVRFVWTVRRMWSERRPDKDQRNGSFELRAFERRITRGTTAFDWDLNAGIALVMIQRLPSGTRYAQRRDAFIDTMRPLVDIDLFDPILLSTAIVPLAESGKLRERKINLRSPAGGAVSFRSPSRQESVDDDPTLRNIARQVRADTTGSLGNFFWLAHPDNPLESDLHFHIIDRDQRIAINGERRESEVRYVIGRILELV